MSDPDRSGVALSSLDRSGKKQDGFLRAGEIYNLHLRADLVTLSGCETTLGKDLRGEGLLGLSRAFLNAGAQRVLGTLWSVDDCATDLFMQRFYRGLLIDRVRRAAALRAAQRFLQAEPQWHSPYYWAAFALQGDPR